MVTGTVMLASLLTMTTPIFPLALHSAQILSLAFSVSGIVIAAFLVHRNPHNTLLKYYLVAFFPIAFVWFVQFAAWLSPLVPSDLGRDTQQYGTKAHIVILCVALGPVDIHKHF